MDHPEAESYVMNQDQPAGLLGIFTPSPKTGFTKASLAMCECRKKCVSFAKSRESAPGSEFLL